MKQFVRILLGLALVLGLSVGVTATTGVAAGRAAVPTPAAGATPAGEVAAAAPASPAAFAMAASSGSTRRIDKRCRVRGRVLCIDKTRDKLYYMRNSRVIKTMDARFGCARTRTREGRFRVFRKSRHHVSSIYKTPMPYAMFFSGGQAVHYSADFARRGYRGCSHGCVNIRYRAGISYVYSRIRIGDRVVVYRS